MYGHSGEKIVDTLHKSRHRAQCNTGNDTTIFGILDKLGHSRSAGKPHTKGKQAESHLSRPGVAHGNVPCDLDRIAQASSEVQVLGILNQVLEVMHRSGRMGEVPLELRVHRLISSQELRMVIRKIQGACAFTGNPQWDSDALFVLRAVFTAADKKLTELPRRP